MSVIVTFGSTGFGGTDYSPLADTSWSRIAAIGEAGLAPVYWNIGDEKSLTLSTGEVVVMQIYDFDHDDLGWGEMSHITFGCKNLLDTKRRMNETATNYYGYPDSEMGIWVNGDLFNSLPNDLRDVVKPVEKQTAAGGTSSTIAGASLNVFLFSETEVGLSSGKAAPGEGTVYPIFTDSASRRKQRSGANDGWWLRSPDIRGTISFCGVSSSGTSDSIISNASIASGVCFGFCV
jgi:hypothetical protein